MIFQENGKWVFSGGEPSDYSIPGMIDEVRTEKKFDLLVDLAYETERPSVTTI